MVLDVNAYNRAYYAANAVKLRKQKRVTNTARRKNLRQIILDAKTRPCKDCNQSYPVYVMDFDHVKGAKSFNLGSVTAVTVAESTLLAEIAKCDVVCANCHRIRTYGDVGKR